jgi:hypothetical protein
MTGLLAPSSTLEELLSHFSGAVSYGGRRRLSWALARWCS